MSDYEQPTPEEDEEVAREALAQGDLTHAIFHIACALTENCTCQTRINLLEDIIAASPHPLTLVPIEDDNYYATIAVRAYILNHMGQTMGAIDLLRQIVTVKLDVSFMPWVCLWLHDSRSTQPWDLEVILGYLGGHINTLQHWSGSALTQEIEAGLKVSQTLEQTYPETALLLSIKSAYLRRLHRMEEALQAAEQAYTLSPGWHAATCVAFVHRDNNDVDAALEAYQQALKHDPEDITARLDMADMLCEHQLIHAGLFWYDSILEQDDTHPWALPSSYFYRAIVQHKHPWYERLSSYAIAHMENERAQTLMQRLIEYCGSAYIDYLPEPVEATINTLRQFIENDELAGVEGTVQVTVSLLESPSSKLAVEYAMNLLSPDFPSVWEVNYSHIPSPDPRLAWGEEREWLLWRYQDKHAEPGFKPAHNTKIIHLVSRLADVDYRLDIWWGRAMMIAHELNDDAVEQLFGLILHPPATETFWPWVWIQRIQVVATLVLANLQNTQAWAHSTRRRALFAILQGPVDWPVVAAIMALTKLAQEDAEVEYEVMEQFYQLFQRKPSEGYCVYLYPLILHWLRLPNIEAETKANLLDWKLGLEQGDKAAEDNDPPVEGRVLDAECVEESAKKAWWTKWFDRD